MKKMISMLLAFVMSFSIATVSLADEVNFSDVTENDWFYDDIQTVVRLGLINGKSADCYAPNDNLTYAEAIKLAACMNQFYTEGAVTLTKGNPWYQPYVDYCIDKGIIDQTYNYEENATRSGYMTIFANALPDEALQEINTIPDNAIPDVPANKDYAPAVYKLYRAGILTGVDDKHNCEPLVNISRKEVAAIVARMMYEHKRVDFTIVSGEHEFFGFSSTPSDVYVMCGDTASFHTEVVGGHQPYTYQWQYLNDGSWADLEDHAYEDLNATGSTEPTLTIETSVADTTELRCVVTDNEGESITTKSVKLVVTQMLWTDVTVVGKVDMDTGDEADKDDVDREADTVVDSDTWVDNTGDTTDNTDRTDGDVYYVDNPTVIYPIASNELKIETQLNDVSVSVGTKAKFVVEVSGGKTPYSYQWQSQVEVAGKTKWQDLKNIRGICSGAKSKALSLTSEKKGEMILRCVITDDNGNTIATVPFKLTVTEKKGISRTSL